MDKIVKKTMKIDFHIHSCFSKYKDEYSLVKDGNTDNLDLLLKKLSDNHINMCSITDHDYFSYDLYSKLKANENKNGDLIKVFPGVEFSVGLRADDNSVKQIHVICIFDDECEEKVKNIEKCIPFKENKIDYGSEEKRYFTEERFIGILRDINLNLIMIAHQKQSISSKTALKSKNDVSSLGKVKFNELIDCEYFESFEFKNMINGMINRDYAIKKNEKYDQIRFITGSDCHDWNVYPKHDKKEKDNIGFMFTYLKCLPSFRGLAMAFSDMRRISTSDSLFSPRPKKLDNILLSIDQKEYNIPLSPGINVIIGDNSIGKSLLLHKMTDYRHLPNNSSALLEGYSKYLMRNKIEIRTKLKENEIHTFDYQGSIRDKFNNDSQDNTIFLQDKFPADLDYDNYKSKILANFTEFFRCLENKFDYDNNYKKLNSLTMIDEEIVSKNLSVKIIRINQYEIKKNDKIKNYYEKLISKIDDGFDLIEDNDEKSVLIDFRNKLVEFKNKYEVQANKERKIYETKNVINNAIKEFNDDVKTWKTDLENKKTKFEVEDSDNIAEVITNLVRGKQDIKKFSFNIKEEVIHPNELKFGKYIFVKKFKNCKSINNQYCSSVLKRVLKKNKEIDTSKITSDLLKDSILDFGNINDSAVDVLKDKIEKIIDDDLTPLPSITLRGEDIYDKLSSGMNSSIYFNILSTDNSEGIYIVDQPEDDISQKGIKSDVLDDFKSMSNYRQIIMITHNPQFVVNLDVDNVISLNKDSSGNIFVQSGALEFVDSKNNIDILNTIAQNLDGGIESIRKRWKRYEKTINLNESRN